MKRTSMPARVAPLTRATPLPRVAGQPHRHTALAQKRRRHVATDTPAVREDLTPGQRGLLWLRSEGRCELGMAPDCTIHVRATGGTWHACHRYDRARGGHNRCLACRYVGCPPCHRWQHNHPAVAAETGHYVRTGLDPHRMPLCLPAGRLVVLTADGAYQEVS